MGRGVQDGEEQHGVGQLPMEPNVLVHGDPSDLGPNPSHDGAAYRQQDEHAVDAEYQASASGDPHRVLEQVERRKPRL